MNLLHAREQNNVMLLSSVKVILRIIVVFTGLVKWLVYKNALEAKSTNPNFPKTTAKRVNLDVCGHGWHGLV